MQYFLYYLLSIPLLAVIYLLVFSYIDRDQRVRDATICCLVGAVLWPLTIFYLVGSIYYNVKNNPR